MDPEARRIVKALVVATAIFFAYRIIVGYFVPLPPPPATAPVESGSAGPVAPLPPGIPPTTDEAPASTEPSAAPPTLAPASAPRVIEAPADEGPITLGGREGDALRIELRQAGGSLSTLWLMSRKRDGRFAYRRSLDSDDPYVLISPVDDGYRVHNSFRTARVWIRERGNQEYLLDQALWRVADASDEAVVFETELRTADDQPRLRLRKRFALRPGVPIIDFSLELENTSGAALTVWVEQDGPLGMPEEDPAHDMRKLLAAQLNKQRSAVVLNAAQMHKALLDAARQRTTVRMDVPEKGPLAWTALTNKYFGVFTRPLPQSGDTVDYIASLVGTVANLNYNGDSFHHPGDLVARISTMPASLAAGQSQRYAFEICAGPKDPKYLRQVDPAYGSGGAVDFALALSADQTCMCTFGWLVHLMTWLLDGIHALVRNYGIAIIILVIIMRTALHPLAVWQQKSMFRTQEAMARLKPKIDDLKQRYANDKVTLNKEMMRLFSEENVNPAGTFMSMLPMMIQMPILVALWAALNSDIHLRHAPFDGWWIRDLSAPDAFIRFDPPVDVPILSAIPLLGWMFSGVRSINILPVLMGVSMWLQQKYMPKPHLDAAKEAARQRAESGQPAKPASGMSPEEQIRQQQMIAYMMSIMFPLMFYSMPAGLNLYWLATNVFGIGESLLIKRQLDEEKRRRAELGPQPPAPRQPGVISRMMKRMAEQAEELQRKADELSKLDEVRKREAKQAARPAKKKS